jgi:hypothetical protein
MDRIRWDNIARAAALLGIVVLVLAWPHLRRHGPDLPSAAVTPVSVEQPIAPAPAPQRAKRPRARSRPRPRRPRPVRHRPVRHRITPAPRAAPVFPPRPVAPPSQPPPPSPADQAAREFAIP